MAGHQVWDQVLVHAELLVEGKIFIHKPIVNGVFGFSHARKDSVGYVLRGNFQLSGNVELHQFFEEGVLLICQQIVKADTAADKNFLHTGDFSEFPQQSNIVRMIRTHIFARGGVQTLTTTTSTLTQLLFTGGVAEVGGRAAHIMDVALEVLVFDHELCFRKNGLMAAGLDNTALVEG